ncbi:hypothetical protein F511_02164 [Dorcoceras hygrometricum]|uniref:Uncharacterized protein n=1 Tax=Dorcoceras hygrometricum TaxID=472368 RepID=A0A2Z7B3L5_9LAMI|nr:hypothetical protein F511_02164 [Dorcoceras hygrometricum]
MMSLFDLQDVCIAIGSIATLDLPMVVDMIGIYGLKGPYCTLTTTNWFLQALSVIPRDHGAMFLDAFTMIRWADHIVQFRKLSRSVRSDRSYDEVSVMGMNGVLKNGFSDHIVQFRKLSRSVRSDRSYDEVSVMGMNGMFTRWTRARWAGSKPIFNSILLELTLDFTTHQEKKNPKPSALSAAPPLLINPPPPPPKRAAAAASSSPENCFRPIRRGQSVRADLVMPYSAG